MQGFIRRRIPIFLRRAITLAPALIVLALGHRSDRRAGRQPGRPLVRHPLRPRPAGDARPQARTDGLARQPALAHRVAASFGLIIALNVFLLEQVFIG